MPRSLKPKPCGCGCGDMTKGGDFIPGHDAKLLSSILQQVGGLKALKQLVESMTGKQIDLAESDRARSKMAASQKPVCPECGHEFKGGTWSGIDAHWKAKHNHIMSYEEAWPMIQSGEYSR